MSWFKKKDPVDYRLEITKLQLRLDLLEARTKGMEHYFKDQEIHSSMALARALQVERKKKKKK